jgi:hypothetical protein
MREYNLSIQYKLHFIVGDRIFYCAQMRLDASMAYEHGRWNRTDDALVTYCCPDLIAE